jgi:iron complex outermembrane receptor protein
VTDVLQRPVDDYTRALLAAVPRLPLAAVDRIEVLSDGASSTYGTDAVAGVINFITKKDYKGFSVSADAQVTQHGGGDKYNGSIAGGFGDLRKQGWNVYGTLNVRKQDPMRGTEREFMQTSYMPDKGFNGLSPTTFPANYSQTVAGKTIIANTNPSLPGCLPPSSIIASAVATNRCNADTQTFTNVLPEQEQASAFLRGSLALGDHLLSAEYFKSQNEVTSLIAPSPEGGLVMGPDSPYYPGKGITPITNTALDPTQPVSIAWRTTVLGSRSGRQENNTQRALVSLEGAVAGWDYQASALWSNAKVENFFLNGYPMTIPLRNGVRGINGAPYLNPFGDQSAAGLAYMQANQVLGKVQDGESTLMSLGATVSRPLFKMGGGDATLAIGAELRQEEMIYNTDIAKVSQAASSGLAGSGAKREGDRDISALALEMNFPIRKGLELGASVRYDNYSDFGNTDEPEAVAALVADGQPAGARLGQHRLLGAVAVPACTCRTRPPSPATATTTPCCARAACRRLPGRAVARLRHPVPAAARRQCRPRPRGVPRLDRSASWCSRRPTCRSSVDVWNYYIKNSVSDDRRAVHLCRPGQVRQPVSCAAARPRRSASSPSAPARPRVAIRWPT